jgi:hypothetical protein
MNMEICEEEDGDLQKENVILKDYIMSLILDDNLGYKEALYRVIKGNKAKTNKETWHKTWNHKKWREAKHVLGE